MKSTLWLIPFLCVTAFGQIAPDNNAAAGNLQKRLKSLNLNAPPPIVLTRVQPSGTCAIPLLTAKPSGNFKMPTVKPPAVTPAENSRAGIMTPPMEACNEQFFRNK